MEPLMFVPHWYSSKPHLHGLGGVMFKKCRPPEHLLQYHYQVRLMPSECSGEMLFTILTQMFLHYEGHKTPDIGHDAQCLCYQTNHC